MIISVRCVRQNSCVISSNYFLILFHFRLDSILEFAEDIAVDIPCFWNYLGEFFGPVVYDGTLPLNKLKESIEPLLQCNKAGLLMAEILSAAVKLSVSTLYI